MALKAAKEVGCTLQFCMGLVLWALQSCQVLRAAQEDTAAQNTLEFVDLNTALHWKLRELQSKIHKSSTEIVQHYTDKKSVSPPNWEVGKNTAWQYFV